MNTRVRRGGFTLIELLVVVAIISLLAAIAVPNLIGHLRKAKMVKAESDMRGVEAAIQMFYTDTGYLPFAALSDSGYALFMRNIHGIEQAYTIQTLGAILQSTKYYADRDFFRGGVKETVARNYMPDGIPLDPWKNAYYYVERYPRGGYLSTVFNDLGEEPISGEDILSQILWYRGEKKLGEGVDRDFYIWSGGQEPGVFDPQDFRDDITTWEPDKPYLREYTQ